LLISLLLHAAALAAGTMKLSKSQYPDKPKNLKARFNAAIGAQFPAAVVR
jgi:hypothetical protein